MAETDGNVATIDAGAPGAPEPELLTDVQGGEAQVDAEVDGTAEAAEVTPETPVSKWAGKTDTEIEAAIEHAANDRENRARQSERAKTTQAMLRANTDWMQRDGLETEVQSLTRAMLQGDARYVGEDGALKPEVVKGWTQNIASRMSVAVQANTLNEFLGRLGTMLGGEALTKEQQEEVQALATQAFQPDPKTGIAPTSNADVLAKATEQLVQLRIKAETPKIIAEAVKAYKKTAEARSALAADREVNEANGSRPRPTNGANGGSADMSNRRVLDTASPLSSEYRRAYKAEYGFDP